MSTSLAVQPAYRTTKVEPSKARPDRTIFGTTLDNYGKCWTLLNDAKAVKEATDYYNSRLPWKPRSATPQRIVEKAWGLRNYRQPEIGEAISTNFNKSYNADRKPLEDNTAEEPVKSPSLAEVANRGREQNRQASSFARNRNNERACKSAFSHRQIDKPSITRFSSARSVASSAHNRIVSRQRPASMSQPIQDKRPVGSGSKINVPKFRLPPGSTNFMRVASMKITETGAKDLINSKPINKIGLGDTLQYNYQEFLRQPTPKFYKTNGHVLLLGQKFSDQTTSKDETAPGGFYKSPSWDRDINERHRWVKDRSSEVTMTHEMPQSSRLIFRKSLHDDDDVKYQPDISDDDIPLNIRHRYGQDLVSKVVKENKDQLLDVLRQPSDMKHTALVPPRRQVKELNHPIDPPPHYHTNFGENLKYDKFEGGLHLYIK